MAVDIPKFISTAVELYELWPSLFDWLGGSLGAFMVFLATASWWMRGYKAERDIAIARADSVSTRGQLETEKAALKGQIDVLEQRLALATEQQAVAAKEAESLKKQVDERRKQFAEKSVPADVGLFTTNLDVALARLLAANNATTSTLTLHGALYGNDFKRTEF